MPVETEIKLRLPNGTESVLAALERNGYEAGPRELEVDQVYDRRLGRLRSTGRLLRIRARGNRRTLTFKGRAMADMYKSREELEMELPDEATFVQILEGLGYIPTFRYEKYRTPFRSAADPRGVVTIDETPIGSFLELEGEPEWIDRTAELLGFATSDYVTASYASLYAEYRQTNATVPEHMVF